MDLRLEDSVHGEATVVAVAGELDALSAPQLDAHLTGLWADRPNYLVVDLSGVEFLDSTGLGVLIKSLTHLRENGAEMALVANTPRVTKVLTITGMDSVMTVADSLPAALPAAE